MARRADKAAHRGKPRNEKRIFYPGVAQLVARLLWEQDAAGSNPVTRTTAKKPSFGTAFFAVLVGFSPAISCCEAGARAQPFGGEPFECVVF